MKKIVIVHLGAEDRASLSYLNLEEEINQDYPAAYQLHTNIAKDMVHFLKGFDTAEEPLTITILSHGSPIGISACQSAADNDWIRILYGEFLPAVAGCRKEHPVTLNLTACCHSDHVLKYVGENRIDEIWYNRSESDSLYKGLENARLGYALFSAADLEDNYGRYVAG